MLLPKIEKLINKQDPTLEDVLGLCSHNDSLFEKLTQRGGFNSDGDGFEETITSFISDSFKDFYSTTFPFAQALARIGNGLLIETEVGVNALIGRGSKIDRDLLDATGLSTREIVAVLKDLTRAYKGGVNNQ